MTLQEAALNYVRYSIPVFPLQVRSKKPLPDSKGLHDASTSGDQVLAWWRPAPGRNIGIATGRRAGFWVFDVDGPEGEASLAALESRHGPLPPTPEQTTGGGRQLLFAWEVHLPEIRNSAGRIGRGLDVRGEGGYIVAPPSVHPGSPEKGIPAGRTYAWKPGRALGEIELARAPAWLIEAAMPPAAPEPSAQERVARPVRLEGDSTAYGEAALTAACREISGAIAGTQNSTLFWRANSIGRLVAGEQIRRGYAEQALIAAGLQMVAKGKPWTRDVVADTVRRGLDFGEKRPKTPEDRRGPRAASLGAMKRDLAARGSSGALSPAEAAAAAVGAGQLWASGVSIDQRAVRAWLSARGLELDWLAGTDQLRAHARAPIGRDGELGPALLAPLRRDPAEPVEALAVLPLFTGAERFTSFVGDDVGRVAVLAWPEGVDQVLVAIDLQDAWALGQAAFESGDPMAIVVAPRLRTFAGEPLGDRYGRVNPDTPRLDPSKPPWTARGFETAYLALRGDLKPPELKARKPAGGTRVVQFDGAASATFWGALAAQGWRTAGTNAVRLMRPSGGAMGFNEQNRRAA